jgi:thiol-disulfide isomerase/thioredoxin
MRSLVILLALLAAPPGNIINEVRVNIVQRDFARGEFRIQAYRAEFGVTPDLVEAVSWLGRGALAEGWLDKADTYAAETRKLSLDLLKKRPLDAEKHLPIALGASIEVQAQVMAARGERGQAVGFLQSELETWRNTSMRARIQKNIHLLSLEGKPALALDEKQWLGVRPPSLASLKGRPVLLFFWAHWCGDCKRAGPDIEKLRNTFAPRGLAVIGPTQLYGYVAGGEPAGPEQELRYIEEIRHRFYAGLADMPVPVSEDNFKGYGSSTTPTLVLIDKRGVVRLYHPGAMPYAELAARVEALL